MNIRIDVSEIVEEFSLSADQAKNLTKICVDEVTRAVEMEWKSLAKRELTKTAQTYIGSIEVVETGRLTNAIILKGKFPNMLENGASSFDMKEGFKNSAKKTMKKDGGWFLTIPFRYSVPSALANSPVFAGKLPASVYKAIRQSGANRGGGKTVLSSGSLPADFQAVLTNKSSGYVHKSALFAGLQRTQKTYEKATQGKYNTFRRVSDKSDPSSWIHPGLVRKNFAERARDNTDASNIVENAIDRFLNL